jgi:TPR repeat protein
MTTKDIEARLAAVERKLNAKRHPTDNTFRILFVEGGLPGPVMWAYAGALKWKREASEDLDAFAERAAGAAYAAGEMALTVGGLPRGDELAAFKTFEQWFASIAPFYDDVPPEQPRGFVR